MRRRTLLQWIVSTTAAIPMRSIPLFAQPRELTPEALSQVPVPQALPAEYLDGGDAHLGREAVGERVHPQHHRIPGRHRVIGEPAAERFGREFG